MDREYDFEGYLLNHLDCDHVLLCECPSSYRLKMSTKLLQGGLQNPTQPKFDDYEMDWTVSVMMNHLGLKRLPMGNSSLTHQQLLYPYTVSSRQLLLNSQYGAPFSLHGVSHITEN